MRNGAAERSLGSVAVQADKIRQQLEALELLPLDELARRWKKSRRWIAQNLPVIKLGPKTHRVRQQDALEFQERRTLKP